MKKLIVFLFILVMILSFGFGQEIEYTNQITIIWDAVTTLNNGNPIPDGDIIEYEVWLRDGIGNEYSIGTTSDLSFSIIVAEEGTYTAGVGTVRTINGMGEVSYSDINWSDVNGEWTPSPFVLRYIVPPSSVKNLRIE